MAKNNSSSKTTFVMVCTALVTIIVILAVTIIFVIGGRHNDDQSPIVTTSNNPEQSRSDSDSVSNSENKPNPDNPNPDNPNPDNPDPDDPNPDDPDPDDPNPDNPDPDDPKPDDPKPDDPKPDDPKPDNPSGENTASGSFYSTNPDLLKLYIEWESERKDNEAEITIKVYLESRSLQVGVRNDGIISVGGKSVEYSSPKINIAENQKTLTLLTEQKIKLSDLTSNKISLEVSWHFKGTYSGNPIDYITAAQELEI